MKRICLTIAILIMMAGAVGAQERNARESLGGLSVVPVRVLMVERQSYLRGRLQSFTELRLRLAGVRIPSNNVSLKDEGNATLFITVFTEGLLMIEVELKQNVLLSRRRVIQTYETTWSTATIDPNVEQASEDKVKNELGRLLDDFINVYLSVNPR